MASTTPSAAPLREVVLVGGGHSHVQILRMAAMEPLPGAHLTVVVDRSVAIYSGMAPGFVAGQYDAHALTIDVRPLARRAGARFMEAACTGIDTANKRVLLEGRPPLAYDLCSLNVGSTVAHTDLPGVSDFALPTRPIGRFVQTVDEVLARSKDAGSLDVVVVGGGAGGVELAFCLEARLRKEGITPRVALVDAADRLFSARSERFSRRLAAAAARRGITVHHSRRVAECRAGDVLLDDGSTLPSGLTVWVTGARAPALLASSGLPVEERGFVLVADDLRVQGHEDLFAVGDCAVLRSWPQIPKAGVYAVRQGPPLRKNLHHALRGEPLEAYRPQRDFLTLLNLGDGTAVGDRNGLVFEGAWVFKLKDWIDQRFMEKFQVLDAEGREAPAFQKGMPAEVLEAMKNVEMVCGGCAAKVAETPLRRALARLPALHDDTVTMGLDASEDVAAMRLGPAAPAAPGAPAEPVLVANLDAFTAFTDDPWLVGRVGAHNALSDLFATGAAPRWAMAFVTIPEDAEPEEALFQVMAGVRQSLDDHGVSLVGGHTTVGPKLVVGLSVWGMAQQAALWPKGGLEPGQALVLSRGLGTGVLFHADMAGRATGAWMKVATEGMLRGNAPASAIALAHGVPAATDVTGFGLAGHLGEMLRASACAATLNLSQLPALPWALALLARGERSTFHAQNTDVRKALFIGRDVAEDPALELLFDPQTAGGLLLGVAPDAAPALVDALRAGGDVQAAVIGVVTEAREDGALFAVQASGIRTLPPSP